jgi:hypothetical protein
MVPSPISWLQFSGFGGVPTEMKTTRLFSTASLRSVVKLKRPSFTFFWIRTSRPGS